MIRHCMFACCALLAACSENDAGDATAATVEATPIATRSNFEPEPYVKIAHPGWSKDAIIYQINTRQFTPEGTFAAAQRELPRLKDLGVDILWLMPIHPIGEEKRKGSLGSPYAVKDYYGVNPEFGTLDDLKAFINAAHDEGFHVILDWVANHTAWDNNLVTEHPDWYERDWKGDFRSTPWWDWSDIIDLDYSKAGVREYMTGAMKYWVEEVGVDGFRCDVAGYVPIDFWNRVRAELEAAKPVFMLAEFNQRDAHERAFDATYAWGWNNAVHEIAQGKANVGALFGYYSGHQSAFPPEAMRLMHVANHDQNSWDATQFGRFGEALEAAIVLSMVGDGIPMIYNGQEAGNEKQLAFFEKDPIEWRDHWVGALYRNLIQFRKAHRALWNAPWGAPMTHVVNSAPDEVFSFVRRNDDEKILVVINFSNEARAVSFGTRL
ncbi:MAG: alpha-amylase family glycosyl hydrolase, partial [Pseudomonadota bacterium]